MEQINNFELNLDLSINRCFAAFKVNTSKIIYNSLKAAILTIYIFLTITALRMIFVEFRLEHHYNYGFKAIYAYRWIIKGALVYMAGHEIVALVFGTKYFSNEKSTKINLKDFK